MVAKQSSVGPEAEQTELDPETMSPLLKAVIQGFQYRDML